MAGNNSIQFLRGTRNQIAQNTQQLQDGQPLYNMTDNYLSIGGGGSNDLSKLPIACRELKGYVTDLSNQINNVTNTTEQWSIKYEAGKGLCYKNSVQTTSNYNPYPERSTDSFNYPMFGTVAGTKILGGEATGIQSFAYGGQVYNRMQQEPNNTTTKAIGNQSVAIGASCVAHEDFCIALGRKSEAKIAGCIAIGGTCVSGLSDGTEKVTTNYSPHGYNWAVAIGEANKATGYDAVALGGETTASNRYATSIGYKTEAKGEYSFAGGSGSKAEGLGSVAIGTYNTKATAESSVAIGKGLLSKCAGGVAIGKYNTGREDAIFSVGDGDDTTRHDALILADNSKGTPGFGVYTKYAYIGDSSKHCETTLYGHVKLPVMADNNTDTVTTKGLLILNDENKVASISSIAHVKSNKLYLGNTIAGSLAATQGGITLKETKDYVNRLNINQDCVIAEKTVGTYLIPIWDFNKKLDGTNRPLARTYKNLYYKVAADGSATLSVAGKITALVAPTISDGSNDVIRGKELASLNCTESSGTHTSTSFVTQITQTNGLVTYKTDTLTTNSKTSTGLDWLTVSTSATNLGDITVSSDIVFIA